MTEGRKRIAVVIPKYGLVGGAEGFAAELTERLALNPRYDIHVLANRWVSRSNRVTFHRIPILRFPKYLTTLSFAYYVEKELLRHPYDLIHSHDRIFEADCFTLHGIPHRIWVERIRRKRVPSLFDRATAWVEKEGVQSRRCNRFFPVSTLTRDLFLEAYPIDPSRVQVIAPGVEIEEYGRLDRDLCRQAIREPLAIAPEDLLILFVSMNFEIKGLDRLIRALAGSDPRVKLLVAGKGDARGYGRLAEEAGVRDRVFFTGEVSRERLPKLYLAGDAYAMLSQFDTFGMVVLEAMAAGLPVIISDRVGAKDLVREGQNGFVVPGSNRIEAITDRIGSLLDGDTRQRMGRAAYETALGHTWDAVARQMEDQYEAILGWNSPS